MSLIVPTDLRKGNWAFGNKSDQWCLRPWLELLAAAALHHHSSPGCIQIAWVLHWFQCRKEKASPQRLKNSINSILTTLFWVQRLCNLLIAVLQAEFVAFFFFLPCMSTKERTSLQTPILTPLVGICSHFLIIYYRTCNNYLYIFLQCFESYYKYCVNSVIFFDPGLTTAISTILCKRLRSPLHFMLTTLSHSDGLQLVWLRYVTVTNKYHKPVSY